MTTSEVLPMRMRKTVEAKRTILAPQKDALLTKSDWEAIRSDFDAVGKDIEHGILQYTEGLSEEDRGKVLDLYEAI